MRYYGDELVDKSACGRWRADLKKCLLESDCCKNLRKTPRQCLIDPEGMVPEDCFALKNSFISCKRSLVSIAEKSNVSRYLS
ncbi:hypothetical protein RUM43_010450 [Polyplax serrata]|uniref:Cytochrome c oxidase assembly factor 5 n=1 Tax=Polyplax serrata TaxID=468196 RepID=A0AAN8Q4X7_POLSC